MNGWTIPGDPDQVNELSSHYRSTCTLIGEANNTLRALAGSGDWSNWSGGAAEAFAAKLGALPGMLDQAWASYNQAAWSLWEYATGLADLQGQLRTLLSQLSDARDTLTSLRASQQLMQHGVDASSFTAALSNAQSDVDTLVGRLNQLCQESFPALVALCVARLREAETLGISNDLKSDYQLYISDDAGGFTWQVAAGVGTLLYDVVLKSIIDLPGDILTFIEHPSWEHLSKVLSDLASVLALLMLVVPGLGEVALAAWVLGGLDVATTATEAVAVITGEHGATWLKVGLDGVGVATDGLSFVGGAAHEAADAGDEELDTGLGALTKRFDTAAEVAKNAEDMGLDATGLKALARQRGQEVLDAMANPQDEKSASTLFREGWQTNIRSVKGEASILTGTLWETARSGELWKSAREFSDALQESSIEFRDALREGALQEAGRKALTVATGTLGDLRDVTLHPLSAAQDAGSALWHSDPVTKMLTGGVDPDVLHSPAAVRLYRLSYGTSVAGTIAGTGANVTKALTSPGS